jgi:hypothetical protein
MPLDALYQQVKRDRLLRYEQALADGTYRPYVWPWDTLPALWLFLGVLILPRLPLRTAGFLRPLLILLMVGQGLWTCYRCRAIDMAGGYGIGLTNDWCFIMAGALLVFNDVKEDVKRLEERPYVEGEKSTPQNGSTSSAVDKKDARQRTGQQQLNGAEKPANKTTGHATSLQWQTYPESLGHCSEWIIDLLTCFRGVNWSFRAPLLGPIEGVPPAFPDKKQPKASRSISTEKSISDVRRKALRDIVFWYIMLDLAKTLVIHDPYYFGFAELDTAHPLQLLQGHRHLTKLARLSISMFSVVVALSSIVSPP